MPDRRRSRPAATRVRIAGARSSSHRSNREGTGGSDATASLWRLRRARRNGTITASPLPRNPKGPAMAVYTFEHHMPQVAADAYVADNATVLGRVRLGARASVWFA